ncbi:hypothetical protein N7445_004241 [Penicillium cf. griseofulvum]|nr:hypothetical protein N7445_004241 [Penicillium cf. griseofulvum]
MTFLYVGLQDSYPKCGQEWTEDDSSDLVNRFGKSLEKVGQLDKGQMAEVLERAKWAGFTRWHMLTALDGSCFSSTYRNDCHTSFGVTVKFELVRRFGADLEQLQKLTRPQMYTVAIGLESAGFVDGFLVSEPIQDSLVSSENCSTDAIQPAPCLPPQPPVSPCPTPDASSMFADSISWLDYLNSPENTDIGLADCSESASPVGEPILASNSHSHLGMTSPANTFTPGDETPSYSTPFTFCPNPDENTLPNSEPDTSIASPTPVFAPGFDEGLLCYPTPPSFDVEELSVRQQPISLESRRLSDTQAESMNELISTRGDHPVVPMTLNSSEESLKCLLRSCDATLDDNRTQGILDTSAHSLLAKDLDQILRPLFDHWNFYKSLELPALGLPVQWRGIDAAADYLRMLDYEQKSPYLNPIAKRIGQVLLYFNYEELCRHPNRHLSCSSSKANTTQVLNSILAAYWDDPRYSKSLQCRRDRVTGYHVRRGRWWWRLAGTLGVGILLLGNTSLVDVMCNKSFTNPQIQAFVAFSRGTRPGTVRTFEASESIVKSLMFGQVTDDLHELLFNNDVGLLRPEELARIQNEDEQALKVQLSQDFWEAVDAEKYAMRKMMNLLGWDSDNVAHM